MTVRRFVGPLLILHGFLHLLGFLTSWDLIDPEGFSRTPTILPEDLPTGVIRDIGALWLLGLLAFGLAGYSAIRDYRWWKSLTFGSAVVSLIASIFWIHEAWTLTIVNIIIIALIVRSWYLQTAPHEGEA